MQRPHRTWSWWVVLLACIGIITVALLGATAAAYYKLLPWDFFSLAMVSGVVLGLEAVVFLLWTLGEPMRLPPGRSTE